MSGLAAAQTTRPLKPAGPASNGSADRARPAATDPSVEASTSKARSGRDRLSSSTRLRLRPQRFLTPRRVRARGAASSTRCPRRPDRADPAAARPTDRSGSKRRSRSARSMPTALGDWASSADARCSWATSRSTSPARSAPAKSSAPRCDGPRTARKRRVRAGRSSARTAARGHAIRRISGSGRRTRLDRRMPRRRSVRRGSAPASASPIGPRAGWRGTPERLSIDSAKPITSRSTPASTCDLMRDLVAVMLGAETWSPTNGGSRFVDDRARRRVAIDAAADGAVAGARRRDHRLRRRAARALARRQRRPRARRAASRASAPRDGIVTSDVFGRRMLYGVHRAAADHQDDVDRDDRRRRFRRCREGVARRQRVQRRRHSTSTSAAACGSTLRKPTAWCGSISATACTTATSSCRLAGWRPGRDDEKDLRASFRLRRRKTTPGSFC